MCIRDRFWTTAPTDKDQAEVLKLRGYKYVLAFNEPDRADQSNMSVDDAVSGMKSILNQGLIVGSPAASVWPSASEEWFQPFMKKMKQEKMDDDMAFFCLLYTSTKPTQPSVNPTQPSVNPTKPSVNPSKPSVQPTTPAKKPAVKKLAKVKGIKAVNKKKGTLKITWKKVTGATSVSYTHLRNQE